VLRARKSPMQAGKQLRKHFENMQFQAREKNRRKRHRFCQVFVKVRYYMV